MEKNESKKVIDEWMVFIDDHVTDIQESKDKIQSHVSTLDSEQLNEVAGTLTETREKIGEAQGMLKDLWTNVFEKEQ